MRGVYSTSLRKLQKGLVMKASQSPSVSFGTSTASLAQQVGRVPNHYIERLAVSKERYTPGAFAVANAPAFHP